MRRPFVFVSVLSRRLRSASPNWSAGGIRPEKPSDAGDQVIRSGRAAAAGKQAADTAQPAAIPLVDRPPRPRGSVAVLVLELVNVVNEVPGLFEEALGRDKGGKSAQRDRQAPILAA